MFKLIMYNVIGVVLAIGIAYGIGVYEFSRAKPNIQYQLDGGCPYMTGSGVR